MCMCVCVWVSKCGAVSSLALSASYLGTQYLVLSRTQSVCIWEGKGAGFSLVEKGKSFNPICSHHLHFNVGELYLVQSELNELNSYRATSGSLVCSSSPSQLHALRQERHIAKLPEAIHNGEALADLVSFASFASFASFQAPMFVRQCQHSCGRHLSLLCESSMPDGTPTRSLVPGAGPASTRELRKVTRSLGR